MIGHAISEVATQLVAMTGNIHAQNFGDVCAQAPSGEADSYARQLIGNVKWGVIWTIIGCGFASAALMVGGKVFNSGRAAQIGSGGLFWTVLGAIVFACIYGILTAIVGNGC